jgi:hypothetical protein
VESILHIINKETKLGEEKNSNLDFIVDRTSAAQKSFELILPENA